MGKFWEDAPIVGQGPASAPTSDPVASIPGARRLPGGGVYFGDPDAPLDAEVKRTSIDASNVSMTNTQDAMRSRQISDQYQQMQIDKARQDAIDEAKARADADKKKANSSTTARTELERNLKLIDEIGADAKDNGGWFETGGLGSWMASVPGTAAYDLRKRVSTLDASAAFSALQEMRDNSPTGGALGSVSAPELELLRSSVSNLDPSQSQETFLKQLATAREHYSAMLKRVDADEPKQAERPNGGPTAGNQYDLTADGSARFQTDRDKEIKAGIYHLAGGGAGLPQIDAYLVSQGYPPITGGEFEEQWKADIASGRLTQGGLTGGGPVSGYKEPNAIGAMANSTSGAAVGGYLNAVTAGGLDEITAAMGGDGERVQQAKDAMRAAHPYAYGAGELAGGVSAMVGLSTALPGLAAVRGGLAADALYGAAYGAGESNDNRLGGALLGAGAGVIGNRLGNMAGDRLGQWAARRAAGRPPPVATEGQEVFEAATRQGVAPFVADVGGPATRRNVSALMQTPYGGRLEAGVRRTTDTFNAAKDRLATALAPIQEREAFGNTVRAGVRTAIERERGRGTTLYQAAERAAGNAVIDPANARTALGRNIAELDDTGLNATGTDILRNLQTRMERGPVSVATARAMRTALREDFASNGLRGSDIERRGLQVMDALTDDLDSGLRGQGMDRAADLFRQANGQWRAYTSFVDDVATPIIGKTDDLKPGEAIVATMNADLKGNNARATRLLNALPAEDQASVRANVIAGLGRATPGAQDAEGGVFTLARFLTNWNEIGDPAKAAYFGPELRPALNDLARVAQGSKEAQRYAGHSNSGGVNATIATGSALISAATTLGAGHPLVAMAMAAPVFALPSASRLMASPRFVRWLARGATRPNPAAQRAHISALTNIARAEPIVGADIISLQNYLRQTVEASPRKAAAGEEKDDGRSPPPQEREANGPA